MIKNNASESHSEERSKNSNEPQQDSEKPEAGGAKKRYQKPALKKYPQIERITFT